MKKVSSYLVAIVALASLFVMTQTQEARAQAGFGLVNGIVTDVHHVWGGNFGGTEGDMTTGAIAVTIQKTSNGEEVTLYVCSGTCNFAEKCPYCADPTTFAYCVEKLPTVMGKKASVLNRESPDGTLLVQALPDKESPTAWGCLKVIK